MSRWHRSRGSDHREEVEVPPDVPDRNEPDAEFDEEPVATPNATREAQEVRMDRAQDPELSVVGRGTKIEGTVVASGSLRVDGEVKGKISAQKEVSLSPEGRVEANIEATDIVLAGRVKGDLVAKGDVSLPADSRLDGNIRARNVQIGGVVNGDVVGNGKVELGPRARVDGDITSQRLAIAGGAVFNGSSRMDGETS
jgi:cytoskeletal protein CcmA (bactofilin family)